jgi:hypothetical protein
MDPSFTWSADIQTNVCATRAAQLSAAGRLTILLIVQCPENLSYSLLQCFKRGTHASHSGFAFLFTPRKRGHSAAIFKLLEQLSN